MSINDAIDIELDRDLAERRAALARDPFPTSRDDVLARRAARQKPSPYSGAWRRGIVAAPTLQPARCAIRSAALPTPGCRHPPVADLTRR